jgi:hypothetical protein
VSPVPDLLRQNGEMRADNVWNWTLPAWVARLPDGRNINVCPSAGACAKFCYATNGTYRFPAVIASHQRNLLAAHDDGPRWRSAMLAELDADRFRPTGRARLPEYPRGHLDPYVADMLDAGVAAVRIHDSGDFFASSYLADWVGIAQRTPDVLFYAYSKAVTMVRAVAGDRPPNFLTAFSLGGREDHLLDLDLDRDRHADVFADEAAVTAAGYESQAANDLLSVVSVNHRVGIPMNNIPHFKTRAKGATFGQLEAGLTRHGR